MTIEQRAWSVIERYFGDNVRIALSNSLIQEIQEAVEEEREACGRIVRAQAMLVKTRVAEVLGVKAVVKERRVGREEFDTLVGLSVCGAYNEGFKDGIAQERQ